VATLTFDKLAYVDRLKAAGVGEREARALAEGLDQALREEVATKSDIVTVRTDIAAVRAELKGDVAAVRTDIAAVRAELKGDVAAVRTELAAVRTEHKGDIASVRTELAAVKHDMLRWMVGMGFAQVGLTVALIRLLPH
jgi:uncharacterized protein involved in exopolysaccharide biosynthesis